MPIPVVCPGCSARMSAPDAAAGKVVKCPKCKVALTIPMVETAAEVVDDEPAPPPKKAAPAKPAVAAKAKPAVEDEDDQPRKKKPTATQDDASDDEDDRPQKTTKKGKKGAKKAGTSPALLYGGIAGGVLLLAGVSFAIYWWGIREKPKETAAGGGSAVPGDGGGGGGGGGKAAPPDGWVPFSPTNGGFRAHYPVAPSFRAPIPRTPPSGGQPQTVDYTGRAADNQIQATVRVTAFPDGMTSADREKFLAEKIDRAKQEKGPYVKEVRRGDSTLAGEQATEVVFEVNLSEVAAAKGVQLPPGVPAKAFFIARWMVKDNRGYRVELVAAERRPETGIEKGFFDNFELTAESGGGATPGPGQPPTPNPKGITRNWKEFTAPPEYGFRAQFPWYPPPPPNPYNQPPAGTTKAGQFQVQYSEPGGVLTYFTVHAVQFKPGLAAAEREKVLDNMLQYVDRNQLTSTNTRSVTLGGRPATETTAEMPQPGPNGRKTRLVVRRLVTESAGYLVWVREHGGVTQQDLDTFFNGFTLAK